MNRSSKAFRMAQPLAVVAVWAGLLGYVIPAAFSTAPAVSATAAASSAASHRAPGPLDAATGSAGRKAQSPASSRSDHRVPAMVRVMQAAPQAHRVRVTLGHQTLSCDQAFASITPYHLVRPGTWTVRAADAGDRAATRVTLAADSRTTLVVLGSRRHLVISSADVTREATTRVSRRAAAPPISGATPKPGGSPVPWLVLGGTGLLLALAGVARLRQLRWAHRVAAHIP
jgi:Domain of unknown function (DUF4397)